MTHKKTFPICSDDHSCRFYFWGPKANTVALINITQNKEFQMVREDRGYWSLTLENCSPGTLYKYRIDGKESYPDPSSLSQPGGVHGPSEVLRLDDFSWSDQAWKGIKVSDLIIYELHTGTFSPDENFQGICNKLDHLVELGINSIELMPVAQFSGARNWGYDGVYPFAVHNSYGGAGELMSLVNECHNRGIAIILDVVYNHFGPEGNYLSNYAYYLSDKYSVPWGKAINFDGEHSDEVRNFFMQNALMWFRDFHIDGLRLDAVHAIYDQGPKHILKELSEETARLNSLTGMQHFLIAESHLNELRYISPSSGGGYELDAQWSDDFHHAIHSLVAGEKNGYYADFGEAVDLSKAIKDTFVFDGKYSVFRKKTYGAPAKDIGADRFVIFNQNHDQVGNRKDGNRLIKLTGFEMAKLIAGAMFITPNIPLLFMGEEYGEHNPFYYFTSHLDQVLNKKVSRGRKNELNVLYPDGANAPEPFLEETFNNSKLSWDIESSEEKMAMFRFYKALTWLRKTHPALKFPDKKDINVTNSGKTIVLERWKGVSKLFALLNFEPRGKSFTVPAGLEEGFYKILDSASTKWMGHGEKCPFKISANDQIALPGRSFLVYSNKSI